MTVKLLTEHHLEFLSLKGDYTGSFESALVKMPHCWKLHVTAQVFYCMTCDFSGMMYGLTRLMNISFDLNDSFFFGAIISATDPGKNSTTVNLCKTATQK